MSLKGLFAAAMLALVVAPAAEASQQKGSASKRCLADVIYAEARGESRQGQVAVAEVVMNRVGKSGFAGSVCGVVRQKGQFAPRAHVSEGGAYQVALSVADDVLSGRAPKVTNGAMYFHTPAVKPSWSKRFKRTNRIGSHIFYRPH